MLRLGRPVPPRHWLLNKIRQTVGSPSAGADARPRRRVAAENRALILRPFTLCCASLTSWPRDLGGNTDHRHVIEIPVRGHISKLELQQGRGRSCGEVERVLDVAVRLGRAGFGVERQPPTLALEAFARLSACSSAAKTSARSSARRPFAGSPLASRPAHPAPRASRRSRHC